MSLFREQRLEDSQESAGGLRNGLFYDRSFSIRWRFIAHLTLMIPPSPINKEKTESVGTNSKNGFLFEIKNYNDHLKLFSMLNTARHSIHVVYQ